MESQPSCRRTPAGGKEGAGGVLHPRGQGQLSGLCSCWPQTQAAGWRQAHLTLAHTKDTGGEFEE